MIVEEPYFTSPTYFYKELVDKINNEISLEYEEQKLRNFEKACEHGWKAWETLLELMNNLNLNALFELEHKIPSNYDLLAWAGSFSDNLHHACLKNRQLIPMKIKFLHEYVEMHEDYLDEEVRNLGNIRAFYAESVYQQGNIELGDSLFQKWLDSDPQWTGGWVSWADCYWLWKFLDIQKNYKKAEKIYQKGLELCKPNDRAFIIERLEQLQHEKSDDR